MDLLNQPEVRPIPLQSKYQEIYVFKHLLKSRPQPRSILRRCSHLHLDILEDRNLLSSYALTPVQIHAVQLEDDDGGRQADITPAQVQQWVQEANVVYTASGITLKFDPSDASSFSTFKSTLVNDMAGDGDANWSAEKQVANFIGGQFPGQIVVLFRHGPGNSPTGGGFSWKDLNFVAMPGFNDTYVGGHQNISLFAHELGHYLGLSHTFSQGFDTVADAQQFFASHGYNPGAFDGDGLTDTAPDPYVSSLDPSSTTSITLTDGSNNPVAFPLPVNDIMSYWDNPVKNLSTQQIAIVRETFLYRGLGSAGAEAGGSVIASVSRYAGHLDLFTVGYDGGVYSAWWDANADGGSWTHTSNGQPYTWFRIGDSGLAPQGATISAVARTSQHLDVFVVSTDGAIYSAWWDAAADGGSWVHSAGNNQTYTWFRIGLDGQQVPPGTPISAVAQNDHHLDLFVVGYDGGVYGAWWDQNADNASWTHAGNDGPYSLYRIGSGPDTFPQFTPITAVSRCSGELDLFAVGFDGHIYSAYWNANVDGGSWTHPGDGQPYTWFRIGREAWQVFPQGDNVTAVARNNHHIDLFLTGYDGGLYSAWWDRDADNASWTHATDGGSYTWFRIGSAGEVVRDGTTVTATSRNADHVDVFIVGLDGGVYSAWWDANADNGSWTHNGPGGPYTWFRIGTEGWQVFPQLSVLGAAAQGDHNEDIFTVGFDGGIYSAWWDANADNANWTHATANGSYTWFRIGSAGEVFPPGPFGETPGIQNVWYAAGLAFWLTAMENGLTDEQLEAAFIGSPEYYQHAGGTDRGWVETMYQDLLGRRPDAAGENAWLQLLAGGANRARVAYGFAASDEREGLRVEDDYRRYLGRTASREEVLAWVSAFRRGLTNEDVVSAFLGSEEFYQKETSSS
jgi:hypothetical protein